MGIYVNPGKTAFEEAVKSEIFVDKSEMIFYLNSVLLTKQKYVSVSRPRRFGKTMAADMICAYYSKNSDSRELFEKLKLGKAENKHGEMEWDAYLEGFDVIRVVMTDFLEDSDNVDQMIDYLTEEVVSELLGLYPDVTISGRVKLRTVMNKIFERMNQQFVIVIDEWDAVFRVWPEDANGQKKYLDFLRDWLKDRTYIALAYMTGILPIKKYGEHSALNMFTEYSMESPRQLAAYTGFTDEEVVELCKKFSMDYKEVSDWYDGYVICDQIPLGKREDYRNGLYNGHKVHIYNPLSVVESMTTGQIRNYWNKTETYEALAEYIRMDYDGLKNSVILLMEGGRLKINTSTYQNDMTTFSGRDDVLSLLIHLGYLGYDDETSEVFIPNREILDEFHVSTKGNEWIGVIEAYNTSLELLKATWDCEADKVAELLERAHDQADNKTYNSEAALSYSVKYAYYAAQLYYTTILELDSGKGYADIVYLPAPKFSDKPVLLVELKYDKTAEGAISQIKKQHYPERLEHYKGNILLVGVNYDNKASNNDVDYKHHSCVIERV